MRRSSTQNSRLPRIALMMAIRRSIRLPAPDIWFVALAIVFLTALALRLYGIDWDDGADLHPDELFVAKIVLIDRIRFEWPPDLDTLLDPARSGELRRQIVESLQLPDRFTPLLMSWAGVRGHTAYEGLASGQLVYLRFVLERR